MIWSACEEEDGVRALLQQRLQSTATHKCTGDVTDKAVYSSTEGKLRSKHVTGASRAIRYYVAITEDRFGVGKSRVCFLHQIER